MNISQIENLLLQVTAGDCESAEIITSHIVNLEEKNKALLARLELLNGTAATKLEKHNAEMEEYKKQVIALRDEGKSWAMIAELTGINMSTVRSWVRNAK